MSIVAETTQANLLPAALDVTEAVRKASQRLEAIPGIRRRFGVIRLWPELQIAEHECIERLRRAAQLIGAELVDLDRHGKIVLENERPVTEADVDFVLHLHFETAKCYEPFSIGALWNPHQYYFDFGYERVWSNQLSHDLFATAGSKQLQKLIAAGRGPVAASQMPLLNHTLSQPIFVPTEKSRYNAFYCGINWERVAKKRTRHEDFLKALDRNGRLAVYGPSRLRGIKVWDGYRGYKGPLPFDGESVVRKAWEAGAAIVFSSDAHRQSGIMSNRLFEAMAGGSVIIGDDHPFIREAVGDSFISVPMELSAIHRAAFVVDALEDLEKNPSRAVAMAMAAQGRLVESYFLSGQIVDLFAAAEHGKQRRKNVVASAAAEPIVDIVVQTFDRTTKDIEDFVRHLHALFKSTANVVLIVGENRMAELLGLKGVELVPVSHSESRRFLSVSSMLQIAGAYLTAQKTLFALGVEKFLGQTMLPAFIEFGSSPVGRLSYVVRHVDPKGKEHVDYFSGDMPTGFLHEPTTASYVFERAWLQQNTVLPDLTPRGLARLAARNGHDLPISYPTSLEIDLQNYDKLGSRGFKWHDWGSSEARVVDEFVAKRFGESTDVAIVSPGKMPITQGDGIVGEVGSALRRLPAQEMLGLARRLFDVLPIPIWTKQVLRLSRRRRR